MFDGKDADRAADGFVPDAVPLERLEAQLCEVAGHLTAATCRFLVLLGEFDERRGWASWEMSSCAAWLSWKCQMSSGTAREHVRVARALRELPVIRAEFAAARLSYVKVRALTRIATPVTEAGLAEIAAIGRPEQPGEDGDGPAGVSAETPATGKPDLTTSSDLADALAVMAESFLAGKVAGADDAEVYQVVVHVGTDAIGVSAETPPPAPGDPADPARCHVEDGAAISVATAQMIGCSAALSWLLHGAGGRVLDLGRRRRRPNAALRKAARERDHGRCRYPGCESRKVDLHHIQYWSNGGRTSLDNLISLCKRHHMAVHDRGYLIAARDDATFAFCQPDGTPVHQHLPGQRADPRRPRGRP